MLGRRAARLMGTTVPGRWEGYTPLQPDATSDFYGFRAGLPGFDFQNRFGREPCMRVLAAVELAAETSTTARLAEEDYRGIGAEKWGSR